MTVAEKWRIELFEISKILVSALYIFILLRSAAENDSCQQYIGWCSSVDSSFMGRSLP